jgi:uncharacterized protein
MNVLLTGATGLIGSALRPFLEARGCRVVSLRRRRGQAAAPTAVWNPAERTIDLSSAGPLDAVVHLAGESIAQRWTSAAKERIRASRVDGTRLLCEAITRLPRPPQTLVSASAVGFYGHRGEELLDERSGGGSGFLADTCREWEAATAPAAAQGIRVVLLRLGIVLTPPGGALARMLPAFRLGLGGRLGCGDQYWSWITLGDLLRAIWHVLEQEDFRGPANAVAPGAVTNADFTRTLAAALRRPTLAPVPAWAVKLLLGEMGMEALLASTRVSSTRLLETGFTFHHPELAPALEAMWA